MPAPYYEQNYHAQISNVPDSSFGQIMKETFLKAFVWNARSTRKTFWIGWAASEVVKIILALICIPIVATIFVFTDNGDGFRFTIVPAAWWISLVLLVLLLGFIYLDLCQLGLSVRRLHDQNRSGYWLWLLLLPTVGEVIVLLLMLWPTAEIPVQWNRYLSIKK